MKSIIPNIVLPDLYRPSSRQSTARSSTRSPPRGPNPQIPKAGKRRSRSYAEIADHVLREGPPRREGSLQKTKDTFYKITHWRERWFVLMNNSLYYYVDRATARTCPDRPLGRIQLTRAVLHSIHHHGGYALDEPNPSSSITEVEESSAPTTGSLDDKADDGSPSNEPFVSPLDQSNADATPLGALNGWGLGSVVSGLSYLGLGRERVASVQRETPTHSIPAHSTHQSSGSSNAHKVTGDGHSDSASDAVDGSPDEAHYFYLKVPEKTFVLYAAEASQAAEWVRDIAQSQRYFEFLANQEKMVNEHLLSGFQWQHLGGSILKDSSRYLFPGTKPMERTTDPPEFSLHEGAEAHVGWLDPILGLFSRDHAHQDGSMTSLSHWIPQPRQFPACAAAQQGAKVYLWGGLGPGQTPVGCDFAIFHRDRGQWESIPSIPGGPSPRYGHTMTCVEPYLYVFGGVTLSPNLEYCNDLYRFHMEKKQWEAIHPQGSFRYKHDRSHHIRVKDRGRWPSPRAFHTTSFVRTVKKMKANDTSDMEEEGEYLVTLGGTQGQHLIGGLWVFDLQRMEWYTPHVSPVYTVEEDGSPRVAYPSLRAYHTATAISDDAPPEDSSHQPLLNHIFVYGGVGYSSDTYDARVWPAHEWWLLRVLHSRKFRWERIQPTATGPTHLNVTYTHAAAALGTRRIALLLPSNPSLSSSSIIVPSLSMEAETHDSETGNHSEDLRGRVYIFDTARHLWFVPNSFSGSIPSSIPSGAGVAALSLDKLLVFGGSIGPLFQPSAEMSGCGKEKAKKDAVKKIVDLDDNMGRAGKEKEEEVDVDRESSIRISKPPEIAVDMLTNVSSCLCCLSLPREWDTAFQPSASSDAQRCVYCKESHCDYRLIHLHALHVRCIGAFLRQLEALTSSEKPLDDAHPPLFLTQCPIWCMDMANDDARERNALLQYIHSALELRSNPLGRNLGLFAHHFALQYDGASECGSTESAARGVKRATREMLLYAERLQGIILSKFPLLYDAGELNMGQAGEISVMLVVKRWIGRRIGETLRSLFMRWREEEDQTFSRCKEDLLRLNMDTPKALGVRKEFRLSGKENSWTCEKSKDEKPFGLAIRVLNRLPKYFSAEAKMDCISLTRHAINSCVAEFWRGCPPHQRPGPAKLVIMADDLYAIMGYVLLHSDVSNPHAELSMVEEMMDVESVESEKSFGLTAFMGGMLQLEAIAQRVDRKSVV